MKKMLLCLGFLWAVLTLAAWFLPARAVDDAERRPLAQFPQTSLQTVLDGTFQSGFEDYAQDQFPLRQTFRQLKALFHTYALNQKDNNGIYMTDGFAVAQEYPLKEAALEHALSRLEYLHEKYLQDSRVVMAVIPDKNYYLAMESGQLSLDYDTLFEKCRLPWAENLDLTGALTAEDFYRTDTHWRQERLFPAASAICQALGVTGPDPADYSAEALARPFYGVYYGQAALPMEPDTMYLLRSDLLSQCTVYDYESGQVLPIYDEGRLTAKDLYEVYLSGPRSLLTITNPGAATDRELILFRDSFASAITPLLLTDYRTVTLVDIRYIQIDMLSRFLDFHGQDVLILYSALVLNNGTTIK